MNLLSTALLVAVVVSCLPGYRTAAAEGGTVSGAQFERVGPFGGDVRSLLLSSTTPDRIYLGTSDGQIYRSEDGGASWSRIHPGIGRRQLVIDTLVQHPADRSRLYAGAWDLRSKGGGLFESRDDGASWTQVRLPELSPAVRDFAICTRKPEHMIVGTLNGAYVSSDGGSTWAQVTGDFRDIESVAIHPDKPQVLYLGTWRLGYRSTDFGRTWTRVNQGMLLDSDVFSISIDPRNPEVMYAGACSGIYRSADGASSWTRLRVFPTRFTVRTQVVTVDPSDPHRAYAGTTEGLFVSQDDGRTWSRSTAPGVVVNAVQIDPRNNGRILLGTGNEGVLISDDSGRNWRPSNTGFVHRQIARIVSVAHSGRVFAGITDANGPVYLLDRSSSTWGPPAPGMLPEGGLLSYLPLPDGQGRLAGTPRGLYLQPAPAAPWTKLTGVAGRLAVTDLALDSVNSVIFAATSRGVIKARLSDLMFETPVDSRFAPPVASVLVAGTSPGWAYAATTSGILRSRDGGVNWEPCSRGLPNRAAVEALAASPADGRYLLAGTVAGLFQSRDGGDTWTRAADSGLGVDVPSVIFLDGSGNRILAADNAFGGVFLSENAGASWRRLESPEYSSPVRYIARDPVDPSCVYLGTNSDGVYRLRMQEPTVASESH
jgi:photosystem II stability/assembly factor-like uncharacterized protein